MGTHQYPGAPYQPERLGVWSRRVGGANNRGWGGEAHARYACHASSERPRGVGALPAMNEKNNNTHHESGLPAPTNIIIISSSIVSISSNSHSTVVATAAAPVIHSHPLGKITFGSQDSIHSHTRAYQPQLSTDDISILLYTGTPTKTDLDTAHNLCTFLVDKSRHI